MIALRQPHPKAKSRTYTMDKYLKTALDLHGTWAKLVYEINKHLTRAGQPALSQQAIQNWATRGIPANRAFVIERVTDGKVKAKDIIKG